MVLVTKGTSPTRFSPTPLSTCIFSAHGVLIARNLYSPNGPNLNPRFHKAGDNDQIQVFYCKHLSQSLSTNKIVRLTSQAMDVHCPLKLKKTFSEPAYLLLSQSAAPETFVLVLVLEFQPASVSILMGEAQTIQCDMVGSYLSLTQKRHIRFYRVNDHSLTSCERRRP